MHILVVVTLTDVITFAGKLKIYKDEKCTKSLKVDEDGNAILGMNVVNVGEVETMELYIVNESEHRFELSKVESADPDVDFEFEKKILRKNKPVKMTVTFSPKVGRVTFLNANFKIKGRFVIQGTAY